MKSRRRLRLFGVPIRFDFSAIFLVYLFGMWGFNVTDNLVGATGYVLVFFASLLTHEFMHILVARRFKISCDQIVIMMFGAGAILDETGDSPDKIFAISVVGPLTSFVLAVAFFGVSQAQFLTGTMAHIIYFGIFINLMLGIFNVIPMYPLDGGRIAHAIAWKLSGDEQRGRVIAVWLSRALIVGLMLWTAYEFSQGILPIFAVLWRGALAVLLWLMGARELNAGSKEMRSKAAKREIEDADEGCVFCNRENFEDRIIYEDEWFFVIPTLGQFVPNGGYSLVIPKRHVRCMGEMAPGEAESFGELVFRVAGAIGELWGEGDDAVCIFEHGIAGQTVKHAHVHIVPRAILELDEKILDDSVDAKWDSMYSFGELHEKYVSNESKPYLLFSQSWPYQPMFVLFLEDATQIPAQYLRSVSAEIVTGDAKNGNWRNADPDVDKERMDETVRRLSPYFSKDER